MSAEVNTYQNHPVAKMQQQLAPYVSRTSLATHEYLGRNVTLLAKYESEQITGSFKARGALAALLELQSAEATRVVTASAGNHGAGIAYGAETLGMHATIHVPEGTPRSKLDNIRTLGGKSVMIVEQGSSFAATEKRAQRQANRFSRYVPPFDSGIVVLGQSTMTAEILETCPDVDTIFVPVGGGGALAGAILAVREHGSRAKIVGVQTKGNDSLQTSLAHGEQRPASAVDALCEGTAVRRIGKVCFDIIHRNRQIVDIITVDAVDIGREVVSEDRQRQELVPVLGSLAFSHFPETTGLVALAGARKYHQENPHLDNQTWVAIVTGSNSDPAREAKAVDAWMRQESAKEHRAFSVASAQVVR